MNSQIDLHSLAVDRTSQGGAFAARPARWMSRYVFPMGILAAFLALFLWAARSSLRSATPVTVTTVIASQATAQQEGAPLFQAAGWIEPRPTSVFVPALAEGIVDRLVVVEGQPLQKGDPVAYLVDADAKLAVSDAVANLELRQAEFATASATLESAKQTAAEPISLQAELADAEAKWAKARAELDRLPFQIETAKLKKNLADKELKSKVQLGSAVASIVVERSQSDVSLAVNALAELQNQQPRLEKELESISRRRDILKRQLELHVQETRLLAEAAGNCKVAQARIEQAKIAIEVAKLRLSRMIVRAPITGRVLALMARPGARLMGMDSANRGESSPVITMFDPSMLQIRADVRLEDVPRVREGQPVRIETAALNTPIDGVVLTSTSFADVAKNTLQVKVAILSPPAVLRPDMLVQTTFLAPKTAGKSKESSVKSLRIYIPKRMIGTDSGGSYVWLADQLAGKALRRNVKPAVLANGDLIEILEGLSIGDRLIVSGRDGLQNGQYIRITGEESTL